MIRTLTTRYATLLSVVLALALTAALAACGSDEPSGVTGPDRTASTPTETPSSPDQTASTPASGDAPTTTDAPEPAAATSRPVLGPTSVETDREALVALYNATDGENWNKSANWLSDAPLGEWYGVTTDGDGRVTALTLEGNQLSGEIPPELGNLSNLASLWLRGNRLTGCVPEYLYDTLGPKRDNLGDLWFCNVELPPNTPTPAPTPVPTAIIVAAVAPDPTAIPAATSAPEPTITPVTTPAPATATAVVGIAVTPIARPAATATPLAPTSSSVAIDSFNNDSMEVFLSEFSADERSCVVDKVEDTYLNSILVNPYSFAAPEEVWAGFIQCLGDQSLLRLVFTGYQGRLSLPYTEDYFEDLSDGTWQCIRDGFGALEMSDLVASNPTVFYSIRFSGKALTTPCLSDEEWTYLLQTGQEREEDAVNLETFRCVVAEYGGIEQIGAELKHYLANPELADNPDERVIALNEATASCG